MPALEIRDVGIREVFVPRDGCAYADIDIEALELCTLGQVEIWTIKDDTKAKQLNSGVDLHCVTGASINQTPYREFFRQAKGYDPDDRKLIFPTSKTVKEVRNLAKVPNFGKPGGMADTTLVSFARTSYGIRLAATESNPRPSREQQDQEAIRIGGAWRKANPHDQEYLNFIRTLKNKHGSYDVIIGHPSIGNIIRRGKATYCAAANSPFQGLGALAAAEITWLIQKACYNDPKSPLYRCRLVMHAYDEWLIEIPLKHCNPTLVCHELERLVTLGGSVKVPDVRLHGEAVLMNRWSKIAERVERDDGTILIWGTEEADELLAARKAAKK